MTSEKYSYTMLRTQRFKDLQTTLSERLTLVDASYAAACRYILTRHGRKYLRSLRRTKPQRHHYNMTEGNRRRKELRFKIFKRLPWLARLYHNRKARQAIVIEAMLIEHFKARPSDIALIDNGFTAPNSILATVAPPDQRLYFENGYFSGTIQLDPCGVNADNSLPRDAEIYRKHASRAKSGSYPVNVRKPKHSSTDPARLPSDYIFAPFQVDSDSQIARHSPWVRDMEHFYRILRQAAEALPSLHIVIKEHPHTRNVLCKKVPSHSRIIFQNGRCTDDLIRNATAVVTINSTVGIEALAREKPVITLGNSCYSMKELVTPAENSQQLVAALRDPLALSFDRDLVRGFLDFLYNEFLSPEYVCRTEQSIDDRVHELLKRRSLSGDLATGRADDESPSL